MISTSGAPLWSRSPEFDLLGVPPLDLRSEPEAWATAAEVEDGARHVGIPLEVLAHGIPVSEPKDPGNIVCVDQVVDVHATRHGASLHVAADLAYTCELSV